VAPIDPLRLGFGLWPRPAGTAGKRARPGQPGAELQEPADTAAEAAAAAVHLPAHILPLAAAVDSASEELQRDSTGPVLERYRQAVRRFLDAATRDAFRIATETTPGLSQRIFTAVARVDVLLADLADSVLGRQRDSSRVRELAGQIKGALIDLYR
jgi:uncharacterized protein YaaR (DUF327 family)